MKRNLRGIQTQVQNNAKDKDKDKRQKILDWNKSYNARKTEKQKEANRQKMREYRLKLKELKKANSSKVIKQSKAKSNAQR